MIRQKTFSKLLALTFGLAVLVPSLAAQAGKPDKDAPEPGVLEIKLSLSPKGLSWGMTPGGVAELYDRLIDKDYLAEYQKAQPGVQMTQLQAEVAERKRQFRRSRIDFGDLPTRLDGTSFVGEFTYRNREAAMDVQRKGKSRHRHFFFIRERLWKIIDVYPLGENQRYGKDFKAAGERLEKVLGVPGREQPADPEAGRRMAEVDWDDANTHLRLVDWGPKSVAIIYEDKATLSRLPSLRTAKPKDEGRLDPSVKDVIRK